MSPCGFLASRGRLAGSINDFGFVLYLASDFIDEVQNMEPAGLKCVTRGIATYQFHDLELIILCLVENLPGLVRIVVCTGQGLDYKIGANVTLSIEPEEYSEALNES
ncbi:hypothetical protein BCON_0124g00050 [Botryotinia convoluta]|uniref:Uncharacterized protein n=1 Tax=Botryotinia convoluta TaxID=54673 RepID=A0A4Z1I9T8_9HELO|nr:hypothetical protein BCON_0124g00050 [Botryotinia convoluta]